MSDVSKMIEKLSLCLHGEKPQLVVDVLVPFTQVILQKFGVPLEDWITALRGDGPVPKIESRDWVPQVEKLLNLKGS